MSRSNRGRWVVGLCAATMALSAPLASAELVVPRDDGTMETTGAVSPSEAPGTGGGRAADGPVTGGTLSGGREARPVSPFESADDGESGAETPATDGATTETTTLGTDEADAPGAQGPRGDAVTADFVETAMQDRGDHRFLDATCGMVQYVDGYEEVFGKAPQSPACEEGAATAPKAAETTPATPASTEPTAPKPTETATSETPKPTETATSETPKPTETTPKPAPAAPAAPADPAPAAPAPGADAAEESKKQEVTLLAQRASSQAAEVLQALAYDDTVDPSTPEVSERLSALWLTSTLGGADAPTIEGGSRAAVWLRGNTNAFSQKKSSLDLVKALDGADAWMASSPDSGVKAAAPTVKEIQLALQRIADVVKGDAQ